MAKRCGNCGNDLCRCPECGQTYWIGTATMCIRLECKKLNAPVDCAGCGLTVARTNEGVLDYHMNIIPWRLS